jgi:hypothetical protein
MAEETSFISDVTLHLANVEHITVIKESTNVVPAFPYKTFFCMDNPTIIHPFNYY